MNELLLDSVTRSEVLRIPNIIRLPLCPRQYRMHYQNVTYSFGGTALATQFLYSNLGLQVGRGHGQFDRGSSTPELNHLPLSPSSDLQCGLKCLPLELLLWVNTSFLRVPLECTYHIEGKE